MKEIKKAQLVIAAVLLLALGSLFSSGLAQEQEPTKIVSVEKNIALEQKLRELELDLLFEWEGRIFILVNDKDLRTLDNLNISYLDESYKFPALQKDKLRALSGINGAYHSYKELEADLEALERSYPQQAQVFTIGTTLENRKIYALKVSDNVSQDEDEPEVLFMGCHHAREWISVEVPLLLGRYLLENYATDANIRRIVNQSEVWVVPLLNPDGLEYTIHYYRYWRKNRRLNADGSYGVDLNRNYGYAWGYDDRGSSPEPTSEVFRGTAAFSEPETRAIRDFVMPKHFRAMISYHSFSQIILYPWGYTTTPTDKELLLNEIAAAMSQLMKPANGRTYEYGEAGASLYVTNGDATDWTFGTSGIPSYTIELPPVDELGGGFFNAEQDIIAIFNENLPAALYLIDWCIQNFGSAASPPPQVNQKSASPGKIKAGKKLPTLRNR